MTYPSHKTDAVSYMFSLSYANYLVLPRSILEAMPDEWQQRFVDVAMEMHDHFDMSKVDDNYSVNLRDEAGRFKKDPLAQYRRPDRALIEYLRRKPVEGQAE